jgi:hypothetical protein
VNDDGRSQSNHSSRRYSPEMSAAQTDATIRSKQYVALLVVVAVIGVIVSLAAWCFLEGIHRLQQELYTHLPHAFGYDNGPPKWWPLPILAIGALITAVAIARLPGNGGHIPAEGLSAGGPSGPRVLPDVILARDMAASRLGGCGLLRMPEPCSLVILHGVDHVHLPAIVMLLSTFTARSQPARPAAQ